MCVHLIPGNHILVSTMKIGTRTYVCPSSQWNVCVCVVGGVGYVCVCDCWWGWAQSCSPTKGLLSANKELEAGATGERHTLPSSSASPPLCTQQSGQEVTMCAYVCVCGCAWWRKRRGPQLSHQLHCHGDSYKQSSPVSLFSSPSVGHFMKRLGFSLHNVSVCVTVMALTDIRTSR